MTNTTSPGALTARALSVSLTVKDLERSVAWYVDVIGCTVNERHEREGKVMAIALQAGEVRILLNQDDGRKGWDRAKGEGFSLQFTTSQSVDEVATRIRESGWPLSTEPVDTPWGVRVFRLLDPDGFKLVIASERRAPAE